MSSYLDTPIIYNLFPRLAGPLDRWPDHARRAAAMGFNWLYLNPIHYPGFSGSLYAIKDYERLLPDLLPAGASDDALDQVAPTLRQVADLGLHPIADLVINHTARDSALVDQHPEWYVHDQRGKIRSPFAIDPDDARRITVWGDLAEIDNAHSPDREGLWAFWGRLVERYLEVGFHGFRCDAAYKVPAELWRRLVERAARVRPEARFFAETLGAQLAETRALRTSGLHFFFNSSKWWNFHDAWCLAQHQEFQDIPSISFPETHDTERLAAETGGHEAVQRQRYAFAATFSTGLMMPVGYEFGFRKKLDVVRTRPADWEAPSFDLRPFVTAVNRAKAGLPLLHGEGALTLVPSPVQGVVIIERRTEQAPREVGWIVVNRDEGNGREVRAGAPLPPGARVLRLTHDVQEGEQLGLRLTLGPAEVALVMASET